MSTPALHVYHNPWEPLTAYTCPYEGKIRRTNPRTLFQCHECLDRRQARNLEIQAYYDTVYIRCKGGKHPGWS